MNKDIDQALLNHMAKVAYGVMLDGDVDKAVVIFTAINNVAPEFDPAKTGQATALLLNGDLAQAAVALKQRYLAEQDPKLASLTALALNLLGEQEQAQHYLDIALHENDSSAQHLATVLLTNEESRGGGRQYGPGLLY
jgi:Flp pilus assembly protein TadD